jgi:hypothetical protein
MTKQLSVRAVLVLLVLLACAAIAQAQEPPDVRIRLVSPPPGGSLDLEVGESRTFEIQIASSDPFLLALVMTDQYYPGRGIQPPRVDRAGRGTEAVLQVTLTGKGSTAELPAVCDWPEPGTCWPEGVAPVSLVVGVRFKGGVVVAEHFDFAVSVP